MATLASSFSNDWSLASTTTLFTSFRLPNSPPLATYTGSMRGDAGRSEPPYTEVSETHENVLYHTYQQEWMDWASDGLARRT